MASNTKAAAGTMLHDTGEKTPAHQQNDTLTSADGGSVTVCKGGCTTVGQATCKVCRRTNGFNPLSTATMVLSYGAHYLVGRGGRCDSNYSGLDPTSAYIFWRRIRRSYICGRAHCGTGPSTSSPPGTS
eukprot:9479262-Pyramimonas_sp.AAC.2